MIFSPHRVGALVAIAVLKTQSSMAFCAEMEQRRPLSTQERVRGTYENRIRFFAPPEKIFETFAHTKKQGKLYLSYGDFLKAVTPFNYAPSQDMQNYLKQNQPQVLKMADSNQDGLISFPEFLFFVTLLQIPDQQYITAFAENEPRDRLSKAEFSAFLTRHRHNTAIGTKQQNKASSLPEPRLINASEQDFRETNANMTGVIFKNHEWIELETLLKMRDEFRVALQHYEVSDSRSVQFHNFEVDEAGTISAKDFAKSLLSSIDHYKQKYYLNYIEQTRMPGRVSFADFIAFHRLSHHLDLIQRRLAARRTLTKQDLFSIIEELQGKDHFYENNKCGVNPLTIDVMFAILDVDGSGSLEDGELLGIFKRKFAFGKGQERDWVENAAQQVRTVLRRLKQFFNSL